MLACDPVRPEVDVIEETAAALTRGSVVVMPTETQYSLSIRADQDIAFAKICLIKERSETLKTSLFVKDLNMARQFCEVSKVAENLAECHLPGPLTMVLPARKDQDVVANGFCSPEGIGIRISSSPVIAAVMDIVSFPVTATSANISGRVTPDSIAEISRDFGDAVDLYLDAGPCRGRIPSTVVKANDSVTILRPGLIPETEIRRCMDEGGMVR
jgi:L-threonylcarbamoyladenylate synthase